MKALILSSALFLLLLLGCCKGMEEEMVETPYYIGTAKWELINDTNYGLAAAIYKRNDNDDDFGLSLYRNLTAHNLHFYGFRLDIGKQKLVIDSPNTANIPSVDFYHANGDVVYDFYHLIELDSVENFFEITSIDSKTQEVQGRFQAAFAIDSNEFNVNPAGDSDTVVFRNGIFKTKIGN